MRSHSHSSRIDSAPSTFVSRGNASARQPGCCTRSSRALLGFLLRQRESDARRISLRYPLLVPSSAGLDVDTPSLSWTIMGPALLAVFRSSLDISVLEAISCEHRRSAGDAPGSIGEGLI
ncbi:hypothetical protein B0H13DRAFT_2365881 [Mycena leptocephala]|nr:hypothetical protein B0H13DRAFT_2365881 [Mycena leptocephala]